MTKKLVSIFITLFIIFALASGIEGRDERGDRDTMSITIGGACLNNVTTIRILGKRDKPLGDVEIDIFYKNRKVAYGKTDNMGIFKFTPNKLGIYRMEAKKSGYNTEEIEINVSICVTTTTTITSTTTTILAVTTTTIIPTTTTKTLPTTIRKTTTTIKKICNRDGVCEPRRGENHRNCPQDCPSGYRDNYCDRIKDGKCDPDCSRRYDDDCFCNNDGRCEEEFENYGNCPRDCKSGRKDNYCDGVKDGRCDPDCKPEEDPDCKKVDYLSYIYPIIIVFLVFGALTYYSMKREMERREMEREEEELIDYLKERLREGEDPDVLKKELIANGQDPKLLERAERYLWT